MPSSPTLALALAPVVALGATFPPVPDSEGPDSISPSAAAFHAGATADRVARTPGDTIESHESGRVVVLSLDGLAQHLWQDDPAAEQLRALRRVADRGVTADGVITAFPSVTPAGHASLWTGAYGRDNGIVSSGNPVLPREDHTVFERRSGFDSEQLRAEPLWVTAARAGVRVVAHQSTQNYPFVPRVTAPDADRAPVLVNGYGPGRITPHAVVRADDVVSTDPDRWGDALPSSSLPPETFRWRTGPLTFHGALVADEGPEAGYTALRVAVDPGDTSVRVEPAPTEGDRPRGRRLARHFSDGLQIEVGDDGPSTVAYFRLFHLARDGDAFTLYQPSLHRLALHDGSADDGDVQEILAEAGGFIGNGPSVLYRDGELGPQLFDEGEGRAERRYLEGVELVLRQYNRLSRELTKRYSPELLLDYSNYPDEVDHLWYGLAQPDMIGTDRELARAFDRYRGWAYAALDRRVALLDSIAGPDGHLLVASDHGMTAIDKNVRVNVALREAGLLELGTDGSIDPLRTEAVLLDNCILVNTEDWKGGIILEERRDEIVDRAVAALEDIDDPETDRAVVRDVFRPEVFGDSLGIGGPAGCDLYFDLKPRYAAVSGFTGDVVIPSTELHPPFGQHPYGYHGFLPTRPDMLSILIARGPRVPRGPLRETVRTIDLPATVAELLEIPPPRQNEGESILPGSDR